MIVVDTNIIAYLFIPTEHTQQAEQVLAKDPMWVVPLLWRSEFRSVLSGYYKRKMLLMDEVKIIMQTAEKKLASNEYSVANDAVFNLVEKSGCSSYDCEFVALAKALSIPLITKDQEVLKAFPELALLPSQFI